MRYTWNVDVGTSAGNMWSETIQDSTDKNACKNEPEKKCGSYIPDKCICAGLSMASTKLRNDGMKPLVGDVVWRCTSISRRNKPHGSLTKM